MVWEERHPCLKRLLKDRSTCGELLTMLEIHLNVIAPDVGCHGNDWRTVELSNEVAGRYTIQIRHYNVHQDHIVFDTFLNFVDSFKAIELLRLAKTYPPGHKCLPLNQ